MTHTIHIQEWSYRAATEADPQGAIKNWLRSIGCRPPTIGPINARTMEAIGITGLTEAYDQIRDILHLTVTTDD